MLIISEAGWSYFVCVCVFCAAWCFCCLHAVNIAAIGWVHVWKNYTCCFPAGFATVGASVCDCNCVLVCVCVFVPIRHSCLLVGWCLCCCGLLIVSVGGGCALVHNSLCVSEPVRELPGASAAVACWGYGCRCYIWRSPGSCHPLCPSEAEGSSPSGCWKRNVSVSICMCVQWLCLHALY